MGSTRTIPALAAVIALAGAWPALAGQQDFVVRNNTANEVHYIYVSPVSSDSWEEDILGANRVLAPYSEINVNMSGYGGECFFDLMIVDATGYSQEYRNVDLCSVIYVDFP